MKDVDAEMLMGYDNRGVVYSLEDCVKRVVHSDYRKEALEIYDKYVKYDLSRLGFVETSLTSSGEDGDVVFLHKKEIISYPYEWSGNMLKDAILFMLKILIELSPFGLTLKDALPNNILFDCTRPVFVDFLSLVPVEELAREEWLTSQNEGLDPRYLVIRNMLIPYFLLPVVLMYQEDYEGARELLGEKACNCSSERPKLRDALMSIRKRRVFSDLGLLSKATKAIYFGQKQFPRMYHDLYTLIEGIDLTSARSGYLGYFQNKDADLPITDKEKWGDKQNNTAMILERSRPGQVLDIGTNTGWYSKLAASYGCTVIATDVDEATSDALYQHTKEHNASILPLVIPFENMTKEIYGMTYDEPDYYDRDFRQHPLFSAPVKRLQSDLVLFLALFHHMVLGNGMKMGRIIETLSTLAKKTLVLEFVDLDDQMIRDEPSFFSQLGRFTRSNYNIDMVCDIGMKYFNSLDILDSDSANRKLLVFSK